MISATTATAKLGRLICAWVVLLVTAIGNDLIAARVLGNHRLYWTGCGSGLIRSALTTDRPGGAAKGRSGMKPVEGADYLGVPNCTHPLPEQPPILQFRQYALDFRPMKRVVWSLTGAGGDTSRRGEKRC